MLRELRHTLATVTGLEPSAEVVALEHRLLTASDDTLADPRGVTGRPLATTDMVGRGPELSEVGRLIGKYRLVTLVGVGGVGKTRLAVAMTQDDVASDPARRPVVRPRIAHRSRRRLPRQSARRAVSASKRADRQPRASS